MTGPALTGKRCQCGGCGEVFSRLRAFDRHRVESYAKPGEWQGARRCLTPAEMTARGWQRNAAGCWILEAMDRAGRTRIRPDQCPGATPVPDKGRDGREASAPATSRAVEGDGATP